MTPRIAIIGAGIGGAALALFLDKAGIRASLFDAAADDAGPAVDARLVGAIVSEGGVSDLDDQADRHRLGS